MEHLENDMDDLFQKAGELYPLKTTGSDWDAVAGKLQNDVPGDIHDISVPTTVRTGNRRKWLLLLLLIPLGYGISYYSGQTHSKFQSTSTVNSDNKSAGQNKISQAIPDNPAVPVKPADHVQTVDADKIQVPSGEMPGVEKPNMNTTRLANNKKALYTSGGSRLTAKNMSNPEKQIAPSANMNTSKSYTENASKELNTASTTDPNSDHSVPAESTGKTPEAVAAVVVVPSTIPIEKNKTAKTESVKKVSADSSTAGKKTNSTLKQSKGFYVGLVGGPDLSMVKFQSVKNLGFSLGALIGYRFNNRISIETGLIWDKKYYYSEGEYFKKDQLPGLNQFDILNVDGHCNMFEIPLAFRYDFASQKKHNFFATAGLSSYLMTSEYYSYQIQGYNGPYSKDSLYDSPNKNILSIVKLSVGYEYSLSSKSKIRFEPYVNIPLQGVGYGSMPISSIGIYLGFTHSFR